MFSETPRQSKLEATIDALNNKFGRDAIRRARDLGEPGTVMGTAPTLDFRDTGDGADYDEIIDAFDDEVRVATSPLANVADCPSPCADRLA